MTQSTSFAQMANNQSISLSSALRANTPPTKGQTTSRKFLTLSIIFLLSFFTTNAWGAYVTYTVSSTSAVTTSGTAPDGSSANYSSTYGTKCQLTSGNSMTLTLSGYEGCTITGLTLSMKSNTDKGAGNMSMKIGSTTVASISTAKFNTSSWYGSWSTSYVNVTPSVTATTVGNGEKIVITIAATANSLYCQSFTLTYTAAPSLSVSRDQLNFEAITVGQSKDMSTVLSGTNLKGNANLTITGTNSGMFSVSPSLVTPTDGSITNAAILVTYEPTQAGDHTATLTISSQDAEDVTVTLNGSATASANVINWNVKGTEHQTNFNGQSTAIYQPSGEELTCGEKKFVGWTATKDYENATNAPNDLFTDILPGGVTEGTTFYAVYADKHTTTSITYTWDLVQQSTTSALAVDDQIVIAAKDYNYALSTTQNTDTRGAVAVTKDGNKITINNNVQIFTLENGSEDGTFALATGSGYLSGTRRKSGKNYYNQLITAPSKSANTSWYIGFTAENTPYIHNDITEQNKNRYEHPKYYVRFANSSFNVLRDVSWYGQDPENISIYRKTQNKTTTTINSGYTTDCGCTPPQTPLNIENSKVVVNETLDLSLITYTGGTGGQIYQYYCSDAEHTTITDGYKFSATVLGDYEITATQATNNGTCETTATFTVTVTCARPSITPTTHSTTINTPVDLKSIITSTSPMPLSFAYTGENVYISGTNFTFLAAGTYTITATQEAGGIFCEGSQEITITVDDPCTGKEKPTVTAGAITTDGFTLSWSEITGVSTYRVYNNTTGDSDETTDRSYPFSGLNPSTEYSWTVEAVYSDGCTAATSGTTTTSTPVVTYTVYWNVAGDSYGSSTTVNHGEKVSVLPTAPDPETYACTDKVFVGWSKSQFVDGMCPADLFTDVEGSPAITAATTFYAVFADCVTGGDTPEDDTQGEWTLVTDVNDLKAGDKIIIACYSKEKAASDLTSAILSVDADVTFSNSGNTLTPSASTLIFTLGGSTGAWKLANSSGQFLGATAVKKLAWDGGTTTWSISISGTEATISNTNNSYGRFLYNVGSPRFTTYTSSTSESMLLPQIYKKTGSGSGGGETPEPEEYTVTLSVLGDIEGTPTTTGEYTLPSTVSGTCDGKTFVGWTTTENLSSSTAPTSDYWAKGTPVTITENKTYYAVFATESTGGGESSLVKMNANDDFYYGDKIVIIAENTNYGLYQSSSDGYVNYWTTSNASGVPTVAEIEADSKRYFEISEGSASGTIKLGDATNGYLYNSSSTSMSVSKTNYSDWSIIAWNDNTFTFEAGQCLSCRTDVSGENKNKWRGAGSSCDCETNESCSGVIYYNVYKYTSGAGTTYSDYSTTCESGGGDGGDDPITYTVTFNAGTGTCTTQSLTETSEGAGVTLPTATGCGDWTFAGWATASVTETTTAPTLLAAGSYNPTSNTTLYAVYSKIEGGGGDGNGYKKIDWGSSVEAGKYLISTGETTITGQDVNKTSELAVVSYSPSTNQCTEYEFTISEPNNEGYFTIKLPNNTNWVGWSSSTSTALSPDKPSTDAYLWKYTSNGILNKAATDRYLQVNGTETAAKVYTTSNPVTNWKHTYLYSFSGSSTTTYNSNPDCGGETPEPDPDPEPTGNAYVRVTNASSLKAGDKLLLVNESNAVVAGDITSQYLAKVDATISNNTISELPSGAVVLTLGGTAGAWTLANSNGQLLGATAVKKLAWGSGTTTWSISISNGDATIQNGTSSYGRFLYNANDPRFTTYTSDASSTMLLPQIYKLTSTPASAPARKVAMKKAAAKAAKKAGMARPVVKAPAALAVQECTSYENYTTICCANPITDLKFAAGANSIILYWNTAAASATATLYSDEACTSQVTGATQSGITNGTCTFTGLVKTTTYYAKVTTADGCTAVLEVSTERPIVSVAEWAATQINIDINTNEPIRVYLENEVTGGSTSGNQATELFFSKYYEATANVKLVAVYNGTANTIDLTTYTIKYGKTAWATNYIPLAEFATTANGFAQGGYLSPGEEMILYTKNVSDDRDVAIMECVNEAYPDGKWIEVTTTNNTCSGSLSFGGDKTIALFKGGTMIDIIGGGTTSKPDNSGASTKPTWGDAKGWTCDEGLSIDDGTMIGISTNRCLLVRNNTVTSGANAVSQNTSNFVTLCTEWKGAHVPDDDIDDGVAASCENFAFVGTFDYSDYYVKYEELATSDELPADGRLEDGTYKVTTPDLHDIACTNMRISVKSATDGTTLVTQDYKVPIIVDQDIQTDNEIYFQYTQRTDVNVKPDLGDKNENVLTPDICAECDIVIRDSKTLTHVEDGKGQFRNMMVYPNAKMDNQAKQPFNLNTLQMQGQNDAVSYAIIENDGSTIDVGDMVFVKRIDDKYWYNFSLPYDCKVTDIIQQNGQSMGKYWVDWGIKEYDGKARQEGGNSAGAGNVGLYWKKVEETATLKSHQGYIIGLFTTEWTNQMKFVYFTPTNTNPYRESGDDAKNTTIDSWYTTNKATVAARHRGWNFTGSPYISRFGQSTADQGLNNTSLIMTGHPEPENNNVTEYETYTENVYVTIPSTQGGKYYSHSVASGVELLPFTAYFVQAADVDGSTDTPRTLTYAKGNRALPNAVPARAAATKQRVLAELLVTAPDGQTDNTGVWVDERYTPEYEITADLGKMYVAGAKPQLYTLAANGDMMAYHALPDASAMNIPLRLYAPKAGDYTLTLNQRVSRLAGAERVELLYNNAVVANMMLQDYTITANRGTVNGYSLSITRRADVSTAIDNITGTAITVIANDGYISVTDIPTDAQVSVYDMLGRLLATQSANGQTVVNIPAVPQGVYNIVVGNNNGHTTIKTVIK